MNIVRIDYRLPAIDGIDARRRHGWIVSAIRVVITTADDSMGEEPSPLGCSSFKSRSSSRP